VTPQEQPQVVIPQTMLAKCPPLPLASDGRLGTLLENHVEVAKAYNQDCAPNHNALVDLLAKQYGVNGK
jgi:hypothetical protein